MHPTKTCHRCSTEQPLDSFGRDASRGDGRQVYCKSCRRAIAAKCRPAQAARDLVRKYGITKAERDAMAEAQGHRCYACNTPESELRKPLHVDHCHGSGVVRALLCDRCNRGLGFLMDNPEALRRLAELVESCS